MSKAHHCHTPQTKYLSHYGLTTKVLPHLARRLHTPLSTDPPISDLLRRMPLPGPESAATRSTGWLAILSTSSRSSQLDTVLELDTKAVSIMVCRVLCRRPRIMLGPGSAAEEISDIRRHSSL